MHDSLISCIWKWRGPERVKTCLWLLARQDLLTNLRRVQRHLSSDPYCSQCVNHSVESVMHAVWDCNFNRQFWKHMVSSTYQQEFFSADIKQWLLQNLRSLRQVHGHKWNLIFSVGILFLWNEPNNQIFNSGSMDVHSTLIRFWRRVQSFIVGDQLSDSINNMSKNSSLLCSWGPPDEGFVSLNIDGSVVNGSRATCAAIICDIDGGFIQAFVANLGVASITIVELTTVLYGLQMAWQCGFHQVQIGVDSTAVISLIQDCHNPTHPAAAIIRRIRTWIQRDWVVQIYQVYRERIELLMLFLIWVMIGPLECTFMRSLLIVFGLY